MKIPGICANKSTYPHFLEMLIFGVRGWIVRRLVLRTFESKIQPPPFAKAWKRAYRRRAKPLGQASDMTKETDDTIG